MADKNHKKDGEKKEKPHFSKVRNQSKEIPKITLTDPTGEEQPPNLYHTASSDPNIDQEKKVIQLWKAHTIKTKRKQEQSDAKPPPENKKDHHHQHQHQHHRKSEVTRDKKSSEEQIHEEPHPILDVPQINNTNVPNLNAHANEKVKPVKYKATKKPDVGSPPAPPTNEEERVPKIHHKKKRLSGEEPLLPPPPRPPPQEEVSSKTSDPEKQLSKVQLEQQEQGQSEENQNPDEKPEEKVEELDEKPPKKIKVKSDMIHGKNKKIVERKTPHMSKLLHILDRFQEPHKGGNVELLSALQRFGIPPQNALLALLLKDDTRPFHFGNFVKLMYSPNLRAYAPINTANSYLPISKYKPAVSAIRYKGVKMRPDEFVNTEDLKTAKRHAELTEMKQVCADNEHFEFLKDLALQQMSSLPITIMYEILNEQIKVVEKYHASYTKAFGNSSQNAKVTQAHLTLMHKHLQSLEFLGLRPLPPIAVLRKFEQPPGPENSDFTPTSSSESGEEELEEFINRQGDGPTYEEILLEKRTEEENKVLDGDVPA